MTATTSHAAPRKVRPFYWSLRRELWEHRAIWVAPLSVAGVILAGFLLSLTVAHGSFTASGHFTHAAPPASASGVTAPRSVEISGGEHAVITLPTLAQKQAMIAIPFELMAVVMLIAMFLVAVFYCLGALHGERRDRSILFWRSMPVTDPIAVGAKALVPLAALPLVTLAVTVALQLLVMGMGLARAAATGSGDVGLLLSVPLGEFVVVLAYGLAALSLWWAPVYAWLLLVSMWAKRAPFLWAVLPPLAVAVTEQVAFNTHRVGTVLISRIAGCFDEAFVSLEGAGAHGHVPMIGVANIDAAKFLSTPGLWIGLVVAAALFALTVWMRRRRDPI